MRSPLLSKRKLLFEHGHGAAAPSPLHRPQVRISSPSPSQILVNGNKVVLLPIAKKTAAFADAAPPSARPRPCAEEKRDRRKGCGGPFPLFPAPSSRECSDICQRLWRLHGPLEDYAKHRNVRLRRRRKNGCSQPMDPLAPSKDPVTRPKVKVESQDYADNDDENGDDDDDDDDGDDHDDVEAEHGRRGKASSPKSVLDSLVATILSQNTTEANSRRAFAQLKHRFPTWEQVYKANPTEVEDTIRCGGLAGRKAARILNILNILQRERGKLCLEYVRGMPTSGIKLELSRFKGVGPKTIACVLMFHLQKDEFPVDTHVFRITKMLGWIPANADREKAYLHLNDRIPNELKFDLHCLLVTHGRRCPQCAKGGRTQQHVDGPCPLINNITNKSIRCSN